MRVPRSLGRRTLAAVLCAGISLPAVPPAALAQAQGAAAVETAAETGARISPGDVVSITVFPVEEYSREVTVQPDGKIELALIGSILVKGLTTRELQDLLQQKYSRYVAGPQVTANVRKFAGRRVAIIGEIHAPGYYEYRDGMRLLELVSQAGGLTDVARPSLTRILRHGDGTSVTVNLRAVLGGDLSRNPLVAPGDTVYIPKGRVTVGAQWLTTNILPWVSLMSLVTATVILAK